MAESAWGTSVITWQICLALLGWDCATWTGNEPSIVSTRNMMHDGSRVRNFESYHRLKLYRKTWGRDIVHRNTPMDPDSLLGPPLLQLALALKVITSQGSNSGPKILELSKAQTIALRLDTLAAAPNSLWLFLLSTTTSFVFCTVFSTCRHK